MSSQCNVNLFYYVLYLGAISWLLIAHNSIVKPLILELPKYTDVQQTSTDVSCDYLVAKSYKLRTYYMVYPFTWTRKNTVLNLLNDQEDSQDREDNPGVNGVKIVKGVEWVN